MKIVFTVAGVVEALAGLGFVLTPSLQAKLLFDVSLEGLAHTNIVRVLGLALLALGVAFWRARNDARAPAGRGLGIAVLVYNGGVAVLVIASAAVSGVVAPGMWGALVIHGGLAAWCAWSLRGAAFRPPTAQG